MTLADTANLHTFVDALRFIEHNPGFLATKALQQLALSGAALGIALAVALPLGVALGHFHRGSTIAIGASIIGRGLPSIVLIAAFLTVLGIGFVNNMVALAVLGSGPILTNSFDAVDRVDRDAVEAARGMGMTDPQILRRVELPLALPLLSSAGSIMTRRSPSSSAGSSAVSARTGRIAPCDVAVRARVRRPSWSSDRHDAERHTPY